MNTEEILLWVIVVAGVFLLIGIGLFLYAVYGKKPVENQIGVEKEVGLEDPTKNESVSREVSGEIPEAKKMDSVDRTEKEIALPDDIEREPFKETPGVDRKSFEEFAGKKILVVDDNPVNRKLILTLMGGTGIDLESAEDGVDAIEKLRADEFDLVLMDVNMPKMDGLECTGEIRKDPSLNKTPVLALTASTTPDEVKRILDSGMNGYLDKPLNLGKLYTALGRFLGN